MDIRKPWYLSRTIWAAVVMVGATTAGVFGLPVENGETEQLVDAILQAVAAVAGVAAIFGRLAATTRIE
jgi:hypothetical protein